MGARVAVGRRNLFSERRRGLLGVAGTAAALLLVLAVGAVFDGAMQQITRYIDEQPAQVFVSQPGVRNLHMASSSVPLDAAETIEGLPGVTSADPILFAQDGLETDDGRRLSYVIGYVPGRDGGPTEVETGDEPGPGEIVLDAATAASLGADLGERVGALGTSWRVSGIVSDLSNVANGAAFVRLGDFAAARGLSDTASYLLVTSDRDPGSVAAAIERATGLEATTREAFSRSERELVSDMIGDVLRIVTGAAWLVGFAVVALTLYAATRSRLREIGVMKALGAGRGALSRVVIAQAAWSVAAAVVVAAGLTFALGSLLARTSSAVTLALEPGALVRVTAISVVVGATASIAPLVKVSRLDPASVFRR
jgi:putative ABC transport system permease protein